MESGPHPPDRPSGDGGDAPRPPAGGPEAPAAPGPQAPAGYGGPVPPGGWQQPIARPQGWVGQPLASWGSRVGAAIIDGIIVWIPAAIFFGLVIAGTIGIAGSDDGVTIGAIVLGLLISFFILAAVALLYAPVLMARDGAHHGQTLGKQIFGIKVVRDTGQPMSIGWGALREVVVKGIAVGIASAFLPLIPWLLDNLWPLWDDENRALHDMVVSTHVVRTQPASFPAAP
jgi:uncharacterized RDD family membrane protein YckC